MSFTLPKRFRENSEGFQKFFSADHVWWCYMCTEQYYQRSFVIKSTILETSTADKINWNIITLMISVLNANLTVVLSENAS